MKKHLSFWVGLLALSLVSSSILAAEPARKPVRLLIVTGGHPFDRDGFFAALRSIEGIEVLEAVHSEDPAKEANLELAPQKAKDFDVLLLYDLHQQITEEAKKDFEAVLDGGKGLVVLHHAMANYQSWPEYRRIMGGRFCLSPLTEEGNTFPQSTATGVQKMKVKVEDRDHPVTRGIDDFEIEEEPYGKLVVEPGVRALLTTDCPASNRQIAWCHTYKKARVVTIQLGHDARAYGNPSFRKLLGQAIHHVASPEGTAAESPGKKVLGTLRPSHPRLILTRDGEKNLREIIERDPGARELRDGLRRSAERMLEAPTVEFKIVGPRLLSQSRRCLQRVYALSLLHRLDGDRRFRDRAVRELAAAAAFPNWNPSHFLDTAEMCHAFAIGYDWLFDSLTGEEKAMIRTALVEKGLKESLQFYKEGKWWVKARHNWNQVCNGGIGIGALAVADEEPDIAEYILESAIESIRLPMAEYAPDGAWSEGPGYWDYATRYNSYFIAALEGALGTDFGLCAIPGFDKAGDFRMHFCGPAGLTFNFADAGAGAGGAAEMFWLGRRFKKPAYAWHERQYLRGGDAFELIWYDPSGVGPKEEGVPLCARFRGAEVVFLRSAWEDTKALFVGFKGGDNRANHSHLDLGTFVFDALGERWAHDLGADDYDLPAYFGNKRWTYYRLQSEGHNIVTLDGENQDPRAASEVTRFGGELGFSCAVADLSKAYPRGLESHARGVALVEGKHLLVADEIEVSQPAELRWAIHVPKDIEVQGSQARVVGKKARLSVRVLSPEAVKLEVLPASGSPPEAQSADLARLIFRVSAQARKPARLTVVLTPHEAGSPAPDLGPQGLAASLKPLGDWGK